MTQKFLVALFFLQVVAVAAYAGIQVKESFLVPRQINEFHYSEAVALNTKTGQSLVVWAGSGGIHGKVIDERGNTIGKELILEKNPEADRPAIAYNPVRNEFLLAFDDNVNSYELTSGIFVKRLTAAGRPRGAAVNITNAAGSADMLNVAAKVAFNPRTGSYTVVWIRNVEIIGVSLKDWSTVNGAAVNIAAPSTNTKGGIPIPLELGYMASADKLLLVYRELVRGFYYTAESDYILATLDPLLKNVKTSDAAKINIASVKRHNEWFFYGADLVITDQTAWVFFATNTGIKRRKIGPEGKLFGRPANAFNGPLKKTELRDPSVAFSSTVKGIRGLLIASQDDGRIGESLTWAQVVDAKGKAIGAPVLLSTADANETAWNGVIGAVPGSLSDTAFRFFWCATLAESSLRSSGIFKLNLILTEP